MTILYCGVDVSLDTCAVCCNDSNGQIIASIPSMDNDLAGAMELVTFLVNLALKYEARGLEIRLEATSVYGSHLRDFLVASEELEPFASRVYEINPVLVSGFKKALPKRPKTDLFDAYAIAERVRFGHLTPFSRDRLVTSPLLQLTRLRLHLVNTLVIEQTRAYNYIYLASGYQREKPFSSTFGASSLAVLSEFTPDELLHLELDDLADFILANGNNRLGNPHEYAKALKSMANRAYRLHPDMANAVETVLTMTIGNINFLKSQIRKLDQLIARELKVIPQTLTTVPGIGPVLASGIIAEIADIRRFRNEAALAQFA